MAKAIKWSFTADAGVASKMVREVISSSARLHERLHIAAVSAAMVRLTSNQTTPIRDLMAGLSGRSHHVAGLKKWFEKFASVTISLDKDKEIKVTCVNVPNITPEQALDVGRGLPSFWSFDPPADPFKAFDFMAELHKLLKRAQDMDAAKKTGKLKKGKDQVIDLSPEQVNQIDLTGYVKVFAAINGVQNGDNILVN